MRVYLSENIKNFRVAKGLTQRQFGELFGVSPQAVSKWENETNYPDLFILPTITEKMNITIDMLLSKQLNFA